MRWRSSVILFPRLCRLRLEGSAVILLDTHVLAWLVAQPEKLSRRAASAIRRARANDGLAISDITLWELAFLFSRGNSPFARNSREHNPDFSDSHWRKCTPNYSGSCRSGDSVSGKLSERSRRSADWSYSSRRGPCARNPRRDDSQQPFAQDDLVNAVISSSRSSL